MTDLTTTPTEPYPNEDDWTHSTCFSTSVRRIDRVLTRIYDESIRPSGLVTTQYALLSTLSRAPERITLTELAVAIDLDRSTLSRNLHPLERQGFVHLEPGEDRRARCVSITAAGRDKLEATRPLWRSAQDRVNHLTGGHRIEAVLQDLASMMDPIRSLRAED